MRGRKSLVATAFVSSALVAVSVFPPSNHLIWNRTESAPLGLYWRSDGPLTPRGWAVVSDNAPASIWISDNGYLPKDWPIIKQVYGLPGDDVCRHGGQILIENAAVAAVLESNSFGSALPVWDGCISIKRDEVFLLNDHPRSLDGRYFGATKLRDLEGSAHLLWAYK